MARKSHKTLVSLPITMPEHEGEEGQSNSHGSFSPWPHQLENVFPVYAMVIPKAVLDSSLHNSDCLDPIWDAVRVEAKLEADKEPILSSFFYATILSHDCLEQALASVLANRLQKPTLLSTQLMDIFCDVMKHDKSIQKSIRLDIQAFKDRDPACLSYCSALLYLKGFQSLQVHRVAHILWGQGRKILALALQSRVSEVFGVDIHPAAKIGDGILVDHATGVVIGETAVVGNNVSLMQGVTLGGTGKETGDRHPKVAEGVLIGAHATILGNIEIGECVMIAAGSLVLQEVPPHSIVAGVPAKVIGRVHEHYPSLTMQQDPSHVRNQEGDYRDALAKHEKLEENMLMAKCWRYALTEAAQSSGFHYPTKYCVDESDLIQQNVKEISRKLSKFCSSEFNGFVGIDETVEQIQSLLSTGSSEALFVGIWGMGGIGKTTIARVVFDKYFREYDGCCFLNVKEELESHVSINYLREKLISELLEGEGLHTSGMSKELFLNDAIRRISQKKVLIVLDDVNTSEQLKYLIRERICLGAVGSRVIITSRDQDVLTSGGVHQIHEVKEMDHLHSLKLFCLNAFNESKPKMGYEKVTEEVVKIAQGNPLALKVLGANFHSKSSIDIWECALIKLNKYPNEEIQSVLRFSYEGLDETEKEAFLDIAFFFVEDDKDYVRMQLDVCGFHGASGIEVLQRKALITISSDNRIQMHDLIRQMGWEIVRQQSTKHPERRTRLRENDAKTVLGYKLGTDEVEAMQIDVSQIGDLPLEVDTLKRLSRLRFLKFNLPLHDELSMLHDHARFWSPKDQDVLLSSTWCKELMRMASEIHIKCHDYILIEGCSDPSLPPPIEVSRPQKITRHGVEIILNSSIGQVDYFECSDVDYQQFKNLPSDQLCFRCTYYLKLSRWKRQGTGRPKQHILCDGLRHCLKLSRSTTQETRKPKLNILFDGLRYYRQISASQISFHNSIVEVPRNIGGFSWVQEFRVINDLVGWSKRATIRCIQHRKRLDNIVLYQLSHCIALQTCQR